MIRVGNFELARSFSWFGLFIAHGVSCWRWVQIELGAAEAVATAAAAPSHEALPL